MLGRDLVRPLEDDWQESLDSISRDLGWPTSREPAKLGARVAELSAAYNDPTRARAAMRDAGPARLGFSFARDVPKCAAAVRELVATAALAPADGDTLRVLDLGAGLGATTWGLGRALEASGWRGRIDATWVDSDEDALELGARIVRARAGRCAVEIRPRPLARGAKELPDLGRFDVVLAGQLLSELAVGVPPEGRVATHAALLGSWLERHVEPRGALVVVEPALRDRTRHLHRVRDAVADDGATIFAPCLHAAPCPALAAEGDWCHEDLDVDLPAWLAPVARAAGLRREGLTFSYLVLRKDRVRLVDRLSPMDGAGRLRVVSGAIRTKGKLEAFLCGEVARKGQLVAARVRAMRLDRDRGASNAALDAAERGEVLVVCPVPELERPRIGRDARVEVARCESR